MSRWRRLFARVGLGLFVLLLAGATVQGITTALERRRFARPGQMIGVGSHQLHLRCAGEGTPVVVLESGLLSTSASWAWIQQDVARVTRVCSYDRSGLGFSEAGDEPYEPSRVPVELHAALGSAGLPGPYILVGHVLGAAFARMYAARFESEVAGLVLIDAPTPHSLAALPPSERADLRSFARMLQALPWLARFGVLRIHNPVASLADGLPEPQGGEVRMFLTTPDHLARSAREMAAFERTIALLRDLPTFEDRPLALITAGRRLDRRALAVIGDGHERQPAHPRPPEDSRQYVIEEATPASIITERPHAARVAAIVGEVIAATRRAPAHRARTP